jgi:CheY-like chemotaxis protein
VTARVLVVEDDDLTRDLFLKVLSRIGGYDADATDDPDEVVKLVTERKVDLVLMDVSLSRSWLNGDEMDGVALTRILKDNPETRDVPVLLISAFADLREAVAMLEESGADDYIAKPVTDFQVLVGKVGSLLTNAPSDRGES